jgi:hypothetical protein
MLDELKKNGETSKDQEKIFITLMKIYSKSFAELFYAAD